MEMLDRFFKLVKDRAMASSHSQRQKEALVDLLVWTMFADGHVASIEADRIEREVRDLRWEAVTPVESFVGQSMLRARRVLAGELPADDYLDRIHADLGSADCRQRAYKACLLLANVDGEYAPAEKQLLRTVAHRFGLA